MKIAGKLITISFNVIKFLRKYFYFLFGLLIIVLSIGFVYFILKLGWETTRNINETQKTLFVVILTLLAPIFGQYLSNRQAKYRDFELRNKEKKEKAYDYFVAILYDYIILAMQEKEETHEQTVKLLEARKNIIVWGSDSVVKYYSDFMRYTQNLEKEDEVITKTKAAIAFGNLIKAIRKDIGYNNEKITIEDIQRYFS